MWQVVQVGTGMSAAVSRSGLTFRFMPPRWALNKTPCFDSW